MYVFRRPDLERCALVDVYTDPDEAEDWGKGGMVLKQCKGKLQSRLLWSAHVVCLCS